MPCSATCVGTLFLLYPVPVRVPSLLYSTSRSKDRPLISKRSLKSHRFGDGEAHAGPSCRGIEPDLAEVGSVRDRAADRIDGRVADDQVEVGAGGAEGIVARRADRGTGLPPPVLTGHDP